MSDPTLAVSHHPRAGLSGRLRALLGLIGVDRAIGFSVANSASQALILFATASAIARTFSAVEQGYYYTFLSVVGLQSLFELGFGQVITQNVAHAYARVRSTTPRTDGGTPVSDLALVRGLVSFADRYYLWVAVLFTILVGLGGYVFFHSNQTNSGIEWQSSWWLFVAATGATVRLTSRLAVIEGMGGIAWMTRMRFFVNLGRGLLVFGLVLGGFGLHALALGVTFYCLATWFAVEREHRRMIAGLRSGLETSTSEEDFSALWRRLWPMQSRLAISYLCGFFIFAATNPILFALSGAESAARFGITWSLLQGVFGIAISWNATKAALYGGLAGTGDFTGLWSLWRKTLLQSLVVCGCGLAGLAVYLGLVVPWLGKQDKFLSLFQSLPLMLAVILIVCGYAMAIYVRSQLREIFVPASLMNGVCAVTFVALAAHYLSFSWVPWAYLASFVLSGFFSFPAFFAFRRAQSVPCHAV